MRITIKSISKMKRNVITELHNPQEDVKEVLSMFESVIKFWREHHTIRKAIKMAIFGGLIVLIGYLKQELKPEEVGVYMGVLILLENWLKHNIENIPFVGAMVKKKK